MPHLHTQSANRGPIDAVIKRATQVFFFFFTIRPILSPKSALPGSGQPFISQILLEKGEKDHCDLPDSAAPLETLLRQRKAGVLFRTGAFASCQRQLLG